MVKNNTVKEEVKEEIKVEEKIIKDNKEKKVKKEKNFDNFIETFNKVTYLFINDYRLCCSLECLYCNK